MKTKNVYVYLIRERFGWLPQTYTSRQLAISSRKMDAQTGYTVSPIVKVAVPIPEVGK